VADKYLVNERMSCVDLHDVTVWYLLERTP